MQRVQVGRYRHPERHGFAGWVAGRLWWLLERLDGGVVLVETPEPPIVTDPPSNEEEAISRPGWGRKEEGTDAP